MNGFLNIYKPKGISSAHCLNKIKKKLDYKCGHMGTLDPLACGILPIAVGQAARLFDNMVDKKKVYIADFTFGYETDTLDLEGVVKNDGGLIPSKTAIIDLLPDFCGKIMQYPPAFSAKNIDGTKSYKLARAGKEVFLEPKEIEIYSIKLTEDKSPTFTFEITCGGGTYIRSICRDIAHKLNTFATMTSLERTQSGYFKKENSINLDDFLNLENPKECLINSDEVLPYEKIILSKTKATRLLNGLYDDYDFPEDKFYRVYCEDEFWGIGFCKDKKLRIKPYVRG